MVRTEINVMHEKIQFRDKNMKKKLFINAELDLFSSKINFWPRL